MNTKIKAGWSVRLSMINWTIKTLLPFTKMRIAEVRSAAPQVLISDNEVVIQIPDYGSQINELDQRLKDIGG